MSTDDPLTTISAAARAEGVARQVLDRQVRAGLVRSHVMPDGRRMVRLGEVRRDRLDNLMPAHRWRHKREKAERARKSAARVGPARPQPSPRMVAVHDDDGTVIAIVSAADMIAEHGSLEALRQTADADGCVRVTLVRMSEVLEDLAALNRG